MVRKALALLVMVTVVGAVLGVVGLLRPNTVDAQAPSAMRTARRESARLNTLPQRMITFDDIIDKPTLLEVADLYFDS